jgi:hypothetical protein
VCDKQGEGGEEVIRSVSCWLHFGERGTGAERGDLGDTVECCVAEWVGSGLAGIMCGRSEERCRRDKGFVDRPEWFGWGSRKD